MSLLYRSPCPVQLSLLVFKGLLGVRLRPGDVRQLDPDFWRHRVEPLLGADGVAARQLELAGWSMDPLCFVSADEARELCPDGRARVVAEEDKHEYCTLLCEDFLVGAIRTEMGCLLQGFHELIPAELLAGSRLDAEQLRMLVCGTQDLDVDEWQRHARVGAAATQVASWFFDWLRGQSQENRAKMLAFVTGSHVLPSGWDGLRDAYSNPLPFRIERAGEKTHLPSAHTCNNLLVLPPAESQAALAALLDRVIMYAGREMHIM